MKFRSMILAGMLAIAALAAAQDSVRLTFRAHEDPSTVHFVPGQFNGWGPNAGGTISIGVASQMTYATALSAWIKTYVFSIHAPGDASRSLGDSVYQYKFNRGGSASGWYTDPLNAESNPADNNNSILRLTRLFWFEYLPTTSGAFITRITVGLVHALGDSIVDVRLSTGQSLSSRLVTTDVTARYDRSLAVLDVAPDTPVPTGYYIRLVAVNSRGDSAVFAAGNTGQDSTSARFVQISTHGGYATRNPVRPLRGLVRDPSATSVRIVRNGTDTTLVAVANGLFSAPFTLREGQNSFVALADSAGVTVASNPPVVLTYVVDHAPHAAIGFVSTGPSIQIFATGSTDPDSGQAAHLAFTWSEDPSNSAPLGLAGSSASSLSVAKPAKPGMYAFGLIARDPDGNADTTRNYFVLKADQSITVPVYATSPPWAAAGRIYFLFPKEASPQGTLNAAAQRLQYIHDMGFSIIWLMPVMKNADPINLGPGPGYNITDFYTVAPEYGTNQDLKAFVDQAHTLGLKVILDITPNHSSRSHPWSLDAHQFLEDSRYWSWYEHTLIPHDTHGLGQSADASGFVHYDGWDVLLDLNYNDVDLRAEMINVFKYWIRQAGVDGYRFDVYWGPSLRYGEAAFGRPIREALKHVKPDILLLGETDGTGAGSEKYYADYTGGTPGGVDAAYDWSHFSLISGFGFDPTSVNNLHAGLDNSGYYPGPDALYLRYMENQDEDRIAYVYSSNSSLDAATSFRRTMPVASIIFTAPGLPALWNGQEVGFGYGITSSLDARRRGLIDWNFQGKTLLTPHYQKLATIRGQFPAFTQHKLDTNHDGAVNSADQSDFIRVASTDGSVYAFLRPYADQNGLTVVNVSGAQASASLNVLAAGLLFNGAAPGSVYLNDVYNDAHASVTTASLASLAVSLPAYGTAVYTVSRTADTLKLANPVLAAPETPALPAEYALGQNYPNPFNPATLLSCRLPVASSVRLAVYDMLGREVAVLMNGTYPAGSYTVRFDGARLASGVYLSRLTAFPLDAAAAGKTAAGLTAVKKMLLVK